MFDLGLSEIAFVAVLAMLVVGPKDLPKLLKAAGTVTAKARRTYADVMRGLKQLEREVDLASGAEERSDQWVNYLPEDVRRLPEDFRPGAHSPEELAAVQADYQAAVGQARERLEANQSAPGRTDERSGGSD